MPQTQPSLSINEFEIFWYIKIILINIQPHYHPVPIPTIKAGEFTLNFIFITFEHSTHEIVHHRIFSNSMFERNANHAKEKTKFSKLNCWN